MINPENLDAQNLLAWSYATDLNPRLRNGPEALRLALHCVEVSHRTDWLYLDTLAAAYAECGQFQSAVQTEEEVLAFPDMSALPADAVAELKTRLELYKSGKAPNPR
jgi:serine/threonine-protein kinase